MEHIQLNHLIKIIKQLFPLNDKEISLLKDGISFFSAEKEKNLIKPLHVADRLFFLEKGTVRSFYQKDYKDINTEFFFKMIFLPRLQVF